MRRFYLLFILVSFLALPSIKAQSSASFFEKIEGDWSGTGELFGTPATFKMSWHEVLSGQFFHLQFSNSFKNQNGNTQGIEAKAFYRLDESTESSGYWFDSRGVMFGLKFSIKENQLIVLWGDPEIEEGKTEYRLIDGERIEVKDYVKRNGTFSQFGEAVYTKK